MEEKDLQRLLDMLYGMIDEAKSAPFSAEKCTINRDEALDILTEIRSRMPLEIKKAQELIRARQQGYGAHVVFVIQLAEARAFSPNDRTHPAFGAALRQAAAAGVALHAFCCRITPDSLTLDRPVPVLL